MKVHSWEALLGEVTTVRKTPFRKGVRNTLLDAQMVLPRLDKTKLESEYFQALKEFNFPVIRTVIHVRVKS